MRVQEQIESTGPRRGLLLHMARTPSEVAEAQRLRYKVFAEEMGARVTGGEQGIDSDAFDVHCEHLLVRDAQGRVVGTYRLLNGARARRIGGFYSDREFDLARLDHLRHAIVEVGRSCVHRDYRNGATITLLWGGVLRYMAAQGYSHLIGCASMGMADGGHAAASIYNKLQHTSLSPPEYRVFPRCALPLSALAPAAASDAPLPPLIKGYLRLGAYVCGAPAWDPDFNTADLLVMLPMSRIEARYARHFLKAA